MGGAIAEAGYDATCYSYGNDNEGRVDVVKGNLGGGVGIGAGGVKAKAEAGVDLVNSTAKIGKNQESAGMTDLGNMSRACSGNLFPKLHASYDRKYVPSIK